MGTPGEDVPGRKALLLFVCTSRCRNRTSCSNRACTALAISFCFSITCRFSRETLPLCAALGGMQLSIGQFPLVLANRPILALAWKASQRLHALFFLQSQAAYTAWA